MKISAVIITFNEADNIERCIQSLKKVADEIIVIDSFSNDNTVAICNTYNVRVEQRAFTGYGDQKNYGNSLASNNYILSLDADEALSHQLQLSILKIKEQVTFGNAYKFNRRNHIAGKWVKYGVWYPDCKMRLWQKQIGNWNDALVHEKVWLPPEIKPIWLKGDLLHFTAKSFQQLQLTNNKYAALSANEMLVQNKVPSFLQVSIRPIFAFFKAYILKRGILDGLLGYKLAKENYRYTKLKYQTLKQLTKLT